MAKQFGIDVMTINNYGSSLIFGHPQGPTAGRLIAELIEELAILGGGYGLWAGCSAGDMAAARQSLKEIARKVHLKNIFTVCKIKNRE